MLDGDLNLYLFQHLAALNSVVDVKLMGDQITVTKFQKDGIVQLKAIIVLMLFHLTFAFLGTSNQSSIMMEDMSMTNDHKSPRDFAFCEAWTPNIQLDCECLP